MVDFQLFMLVNPKHFTDLLNCVSTLTPEAVLNFDDRNIKIVERDQSGEGLIMARLPTSVFDEYGYWVGKIRLNLIDLLRFLKLKKNSDYLRVNYDPETLKLTITIRIGGRTEKKIIYTLGVEDGITPPKKITYATKTKIVSKTFRKDVETLKMISDQIKLRTDSSVLELSSSGSMGDAFIPYLSRGDESVIAHQTRNPYKVIESDYSQDSLSKIVKKMVALSDYVTLETNTNAPLRISPELPEGELEYYLTPIPA